jgi:hypothetical protein
VISTLALLTVVFAARRSGDSSVAAVWAAVPPIIDGRDDDPVWRAAPAITHFTTWQPVEGQRPHFRTEARVAYDAANLYVFVRAFDPHPDSIARLLERRDTSTPSDMIWVLIDPYHDRRTGFKFGVNAAGVKIDQAIYNDASDDVAWDAVWEVATQIDSLGWAAEFRIPLSQLRYGSEREHQFGFTIDRDTYRFSERASWPALSPAKAGLASQLGTLTGVADLDAPRRVEAIPYLVTRNAPMLVHDRFDQHSTVSAGGDVKIRVASNITIDGTVNPDFGQVEADPAVVNLSAYESFFDEHRPFFVSGGSLFQFDVNCSQVSCANEGLFYSRRIGRTPSLASVFGDSLPLAPTTIAGAAKLIGRASHGLTFGALVATTERVAGGRDTTYEPATIFAVGRAQQDLNGGTSSFGGMVTAVRRQLDASTTPYLASSAYVGALNVRHRFHRNEYEVSGSLDDSRIDGSAPALRVIETDAVHLYQRPDAGRRPDSNATALGGEAEEIKVGKIGGEHLVFETAYQRRSRGFEINDLGFLRRADQQSWNTWIGYVDRRDHRFYQYLQWNTNWSQQWSTNGLALDASYGTTTQITFRNHWTTQIGATLGQLGVTYDDRAARGGPAVRQGRSITPSFSVGGDDRRALVPSVTAGFSQSEGGRNHGWNVSPQIAARLSGRFSSTLAMRVAHNVQDNQWYGNVDDSLGTSHYTFAHLDQHSASATVRLNYTFTPNVSLQGYVRPFVVSGAYSNLRQLSSNPRAADYDARYAGYDAPATLANAGGFVVKDLQSNIVFRWEFHPGSTLFAVWDEGRHGVANGVGLADAVGGTGGVARDARELFRLRPTNVFLVKLALWLNR